VRIPIESLPDRVAFCDPAGGRTAVKKTRARSAIVVITQDWLERVFILFAWADRTSTDKLYEKIFWVHERFAPSLFGVEANALQTMFGDGVRREARQKGVNLHLTDVWQPTTIQKPFRNRAALQPVITDGRLFMQDDQVEAKHEIATHPMNPLCDMVDATASAISMLPRRPQAVLQNTDELVYARYLRRMGTTPAMIEYKLAQRRQRKPASKHQQTQEEFYEHIRPSVG
jgi:hypothetical protein